MGRAQGSNLQGSFGGSQAAWDRRIFFPSDKAAFLLQKECAKREMTRAEPMRWLITCSGAKQIIFQGV